VLAVIRSADTTVNLCANIVPSLYH
jgi:hypothetical protein